MVYLTTYYIYYIYIYIYIYKQSVCDLFIWPLLWSIYGHGRITILQTKLLHCLVHRYIKGILRFSFGNLSSDEMDVISMSFPVKRTILIGLFSCTISISSQMTQCRIIILLQPITKLYLFTIELKLRDDFRCFRSKMCFRTFCTVPLNSCMILKFVFQKYS